MAKLTRSRRLAADARVARSFPFTAAELAALEGVVRVAPVTDCEGEAVARSRRQEPARPRSSKVGSTARAAAAK